MVRLGKTFLISDSAYLAACAALFAVSYALANWLTPLTGAALLECAAVALCFTLAVSALIPSALRTTLRELGMHEMRNLNYEMHLTRNARLLVVEGVWHGRAGVHRLVRTYVLVRVFLALSAILLGVFGIRITAHADDQWASLCFILATLCAIFLAGWFSQDTRLRYLRRLRKYIRKAVNSECACK